MRYRCAEGMKNIVGLFCIIVTGVLAPPHCDPNFECHGGVIMSDTDGCPICVHHDTCIDVGCPPGELCFVQNGSNIKATCVPNPCMINEPLRDQYGELITCNPDHGNENHCPFDSICTPIPVVHNAQALCCIGPTTTPTPSTTPYCNPNFICEGGVPEVDNTQGVCCIGPTTTSTTTCPACDEGCFHENWSGSGGCGPCVCGDTCVELSHCPSNEFCLSTKGISRLFGTCLNNPCHYTRPHEIHGETTICDNISKHCPEYHNCFVVAEDVEGRSVCCEFVEETTTAIP